MDVDLEKEEIKSHLKELNEIKELDTININLNYLKLFDLDSTPSSLKNFKNINHSNMKNSSMGISQNNNTPMEARVALLGEEGSGKSSLLGILTNGLLDDGVGSSRQNVMRFQHEIQSGKTLAISHQVIAFDAQGERLLNTNNPINNSNDILKNTSNLVSFYDLGGSEKANKTTLSMISQDYIDYFFLIVSATQGVTENTKFFLDLANCMNIPVITIITMQDIIKEEDLTKEDGLLKNYKNLIKSSKLKKLPLLVTSIEDCSLFARNLNENIHPIFIVSNVTGFGLNLVSQFLANLKVDKFPNKWNSPLPLSLPLSHSYDNLSYLEIDREIDKNFSFSLSNSEFDIHENFVLEKEGKLIIGGVVSKGQILKGGKYYLGPDKSANFKIIEVEDIHVKKISTDIAFAGQFSSLHIIKSETSTALRSEDVRKGMSLLEPPGLPIAHKAFVAEVWSLDTVKSVKYKYEPLVTIKHIRQTCRVKKFAPAENKTSEDLHDDTMTTETSSRRKSKKFNSEKDSAFYTLSPEEKTLLVFEFKNYPELITPGSTLIIHDGHLKAFGVILNAI